jgi:adenosylcobinamide-phosphate synthase
MPCVFDVGGPLVLAVILDMWLGEPPNRWHPVAWMGTFIDTMRRWVPARGQWSRLAYGAGVVIAGVIVVVGVGVLLERCLRYVPWPLAWLVQAWVLKLTFSLRGLVQAAHQVQHALEHNDIALARHLVSWHLVSRDTSQLSAAHVAAATVESVAENTSDGIVAPLFFYALGGLPAALAYRFINTADAMLGYRDAVHLWLGKVPARLDDLVNLVPARLTAVCLVLAAGLLGENAAPAWTTWRREARLTASPNAGQSMSAMAGALQVELEKIGHYRLGAGYPQPGTQAIAKAIRLVYGATALAIGLLTGLIFMLC